MFRKRETSDPSSTVAGGLYARGLAAFETGRYDDAVAMLEQVAEQRSLPGTLARFYLGRAHVALGLSKLRARRFAEAGQHFLTARRINPESDGLSSYLAACHAGEGRYSEAVVELEREQAGDGEHPIRLAHALARDGQLDRAIQTLDDARRAEPHRTDLMLQAGLILASANQYDDAVIVLREAADRAPLHAAIHRNLALALAATGAMDESARRLAMAHRLCPADAYTGWLLAIAGDAAASAVAVDPIEREPDVDEQGLRSLGEIIAGDPDFVEAFLSLPASEVDGEVFSMLAATLEKALERHAAYADLHYHCSRVYARLGRADEAIARAKQAAKINPRYVQAMIQLGRLYAATDRELAAIARLEAAVAGGGDYPDVHFMLGELYRGVGNREEARSRFRRALELNGNYSQAREALATA